MSKKYIFNNIFVIIYPFVLLMTMSYNSLLSDKLIKNNMNIFQVIGFVIIYYLIFALFIFNFFIKKESFHILPLIIGLVEIILLQIPQVLLQISHDLYSVIYGQFQLNIFIFGALLTFYILMFIMYFRKRKKDDKI